MTYTSDDDPAFKFLDFIFEGIGDGFVEFQFLSAGRKPKLVDKSAYLTLPLDRERLRDEVMGRNGQRMVTVGVAPRCRVPERGRAGRNQDVIQVGCIWANLNNEKAPGGAIEIISRIKNFPLRPSVVINSGYGYHVYFVFRALLKAMDLLVWNELARGLRAALQVGPAASLSEVMRLPGTLNIKEEHPVPCEICEEDSSWTRYTVEEVSEAIRKNSLEVIPRETSLSNDELRRRGLGADVIESIITGRASTNHTRYYEGEDGRDVWLASVLLKKGFDAEEIKMIFRSHPNGCGSNWARKKDGEKYFELMLFKAASRQTDKDRSWVDGEDIQELKLPPGYVLKEDGIWFSPFPLGGDKKALKPVKVCNSYIRIAAIQENIETGEISLSIAFEYLGIPRVIPILRSEMAESRRLVAALSGVGGPVTSVNARLVTTYLAAYEHAFASSISRKKVSSRFGSGLGNGQFFFPGLNSAIEFSPASSGDAALYGAFSSRRGSLRDWVEVMHTLYDDGLMIPQVAVLASLVPPLQKQLQIPNFILDMYGNSSTGKSTSLKLAASVYGRPHDPESLIQQWTNTQVAVEQIAGLCSELPIYLDDAQHCPAEFKRSIIYMIANGRGKGRSAGVRGIRETPTWHTVALSSSETPLHESSPHEGARGRILPVGGASPPIPAGKGSLVRSLEKAVINNHGHAGEAYIRHLNGWTEMDWSRWRTRYSGVRAELQRESSSDLVGRVGGYIAAIQLAAEVACPLLGLRFKPDVIAAWLMLHLQEQQCHQNQVLLALRAMADYYVANIQRFAGDGQYNLGKRGTILGASKRHQYVGFLRTTIDLIFKPHKWNQNAVLGKLAEAGAICSTEKDRYTKKVSVEGVNHRMVCIKWLAILPEDTHS
jgi:hypothetical protein